MGRAMGWAGRLRSFFRALVRVLVGLLYPELCPVCGRRLAFGERVICVRCRWEIPLTDFTTEAQNPVFIGLSGEIPELRRAAALFFFHHDSRYRTAIHQLKYNGRRDVAQALGEWFGRELRESGLYDDVTLLVPVPLHWSKRIKRGYNQSEEICRGMARSLGVACDFGSLCRRRRTRSQARHTSHQARRRNVEGAFSVRRRAVERLRGAHILLVDDVLTTGATIKACAAAIRAALPETPTLSVAALSVIRSFGRKKRRF